MSRMNELRDQYRRFVDSLHFQDSVDLADCLVDMIDEAYRLAQDARTGSIGAYEEARKAKKRAESAHARLDEADKAPPEKPKPPNFKGTVTCCWNCGYSTLTDGLMMECARHEISVDPMSVCDSYL